MHDLLSGAAREIVRTNWDGKQPTALAFLYANAARLLADFYLSDEVQTIYAKEAHGIVVGKIGAEVSAETEELMNAKPLVAENFKAIDAMYDLAKQIYK